MKKRVFTLLLSFAVLFCGIGARLLYLSHEQHLAVSELQSTRVQTIAVSRGTIYDRYGEPLVNRETYRLASISPTATCIDTLQRTALKENTTLMARLEKGERVTTAIEAWLPPTPGIVQISVPTRYDADNTACHVIGYVNGEGDGVCGVEKYCNDLLVSYSGEATVRFQTDALGKVSQNSTDMLTNDLMRAKGGVALTLDAQIQQIVEAVAPSYLERGTVVVTDAQNGEVLASVSLPQYDRNHVEMSLSSTDSPLLDRTLIGYNIGSVFKILIAAAALENGMSAHTMYTCTGSCKVNGREFRCHNPFGDGKLTMEEAMARSCNTYFIQMAQDLGADAIYDMACKLGFADSLSLIEGYSTSRAILPSRRDLSAAAALANLSIGQGDLLASTYHIATLLGAVASNGVMHAPSLLYGEMDENGIMHPYAETVVPTRVFSANTAAILQDMLAAVVSGGTGTGAQPSYGVAAGKTGTAETGWEQNGEEVVQSWFAGYYPVQAPQYVITVLSENGGQNGKVAAPLFATIADKLYEAGLIKNENES